MDMRIPHLEINVMHESNPPKVITLVRRSAVNTAAPTRPAPQGLTRSNKKLQIHKKHNVYIYIYIYNKRKTRIDEIGSPMDGPDHLKYSPPPPHLKRGE